MEQSFWFIVVGITVFILHKVWKKRPDSFGLAVDVLIGTGIGILIGYSRPMNFGFGILPLWFTGGMGGLAALILWAVGRLRLLTRQTLKYSIVIVLSLIHAAVSYSVFMLIYLSRLSVILTEQNKTRLFIHILLISAVSLVGYTIPARVLQTASGGVRSGRSESEEK